MLVIDEADIVGTRQMSELVRITQERGAKHDLVGHAIGPCSVSSLGRVLTRWAELQVKKLLDLFMNSDSVQISL